MNAKRADLTDLRKMKNAEKLPPPSYREYLDMDTDEEEFGRQETPELDEELPPEPEKPVFTDEELKTLVQCVKDLTVLPSSEKFNWSLECIQVIHEYFQNPANTILTIIYEGMDCKALLDFPHNVSQGLTYFLRTPWQVYTPDNFMSTVIFGSLSITLENSVLKFLETIFAPVAIHSCEWPVVMRDKIFSNLNQFLMCLTDATFDPLGLTIFYVPIEGLQKEGKNIREIESRNYEDTNGEGFIERLERVARHWVKQIRSALCGANLLTQPTCSTIIEQIEFWNYRYENLSCLHSQLNSDCVSEIIQKLKHVESASIEQFDNLTTEVDELLTEATSNIIYLNLFVDYCHDFEIPKDIDNYAAEIIHLIRFVASESKFYKSTEKIKSLCQALGTQIIAQCKKYIDLHIVLEGDPNKGKTMLENCINTCTRFREIFYQLAKIDESSQIPTIANISKEKIFSHIDTFVQRCQNLIQISEARIVFDECKGVKMIPGAKGMNHKFKYQKIENLFTDILTGIKSIRECILDVTSFIWLERIVIFNSKIQDIDNMVKNLLREIFNDVENVEEGIEAIYAMKRFVLRPNLKEILSIHWVQVWKIFESELENVIISMNDVTNHRDISMTTYAGAASFLRIKNNYLTAQYNMLIDASDWFSDNNAQQDIIKKYKRVQTSLIEKEKSFFTEWEKGIDPDFSIGKTLNEPVFRYCSYPNDSFIEINLDETYLENMKAILEWKNLKYDERILSSKPVQKWSSLKFRYNKVKYFCEFHNSTLKQWTAVERLLFENLLNDIKIIITSGLTKNTWACDSIDRFYSDCHQSILQLKEETVFYRNVNMEIKSSCRDISKTLLILGTNNSTYELEEFENYITMMKKKSLESMTEISSSIVQSILLLKHKIRYGETTPRYWRTYVKEIVREFKRSIVENVQLSLQSALQFFFGDFLTDPKPLLRISVQYSSDDELKIKFLPDMEKIKTVLSSIIPLSSKETYSIEEFIEILKCDFEFEKRPNFIENDDNIINLWSRIEKEIDSGLMELKGFIESVEILKYISNIQDAFNLSIQDMLSRGRELLEADIRHCEEILQYVISLNDNVRIKYFILDTRDMKSSVITECELLKDMLFVELSKFIASELTLERMPNQNEDDISITNSMD